MARITSRSQLNQAEGLDGGAAGGVHALSDPRCERLVSFLGGTVRVRVWAATLGSPGLGQPAMKVAPSGL
jgi:hypothetical protein